MRKTTARGFTLKFSNSGFTLIELLIVIAIIAVLAAVVLLIVNPIELTRRSRDAVRLADLSNLRQAIHISLQEGSAAGYDYVACASDGTATCKDSSANPAATTRNIDGTGWVKINFAGQTNVSVPTLPADPTNTGDGSGFVTGNHYTYCGSSSDWKITTHLESSQQNSLMANDGGTDPEAYEVASNMQLLCSY